MPLFGIILPRLSLIGVKMSGKLNSNSKMSSINELIAFLIKKKEWVLIPIVATLLLLGILLTLAQSSTIGTFMYTIF
ncbi:MAG: hypothetical protein PWR01_2305 [Clostridiales bacterium]|nr:hypothetical protein [Clostridiales bacterium]MDN5281232.1 hypothetical protein [Candidatus Ozemobacter sp.]